MGRSWRVLCVHDLFAVPLQRAEQATYDLADKPLSAIEIALAHGVAVATGEHHPVVGPRAAL